MKTPPESAGSRNWELFVQPLEKPPEERIACLDTACGSDAALHAEVEALLAHHREDSFLERPAEGVAVSLPATGDVGPDGTVLVRITETPGDRIAR